MRLSQSQISSVLIHIDPHKLNICQESVKLKQQFVLSDSLLGLCCMSKKHQPNPTITSYLSTPRSVEHRKTYIEMHGWKPRKVVGWLFFFMFPKVLAFLQYPLHGLGAFFRFNYGDVLRIKKSQMLQWSRMVYQFTYMKTPKTTLFCR